MFEKEQIYSTQDSFRRANLKDVPKILEITDAAYNSVEIGQNGLAFRLENTFRSHHMFESEADIDYYYVLKNNQDIVGAVMAKVDENLKMVEIGPLAVDPKHQVRTIVIFCIKIQQKSYLNFKFCAFLLQGLEF